MIKPNLCKFFFFGIKSYKDFIFIIFWFLFYIFTYIIINQNFSIAKFKSVVILWWRMSVFFCFHVF